MTIEFEEFEYCKVKVNYTADADLITEKREEALEAVKNMNVKVPGFRQEMKNVNTKRKKRKNKKKRKGSKSAKGSAAYEASLKNRYHKWIEEQVVKQLIAEAYDDTLYETKMKPLSYPDIVSSNLDEESFECEMIFMKKPEFELGKYKGFEIPNPHQDETPIERAEQMIQSLRERHGETVMYDENDFLQEGDSVTLDVKCVCEDNVVKSLTREGLPYNVGQNTFKEFDGNIYGMKPGEERTFDIVFPDKEEINEDIRNKRATFTVTLHAGTKKTPAPLDDEFAKKLGYDSMDKLHNEAVSTASSQIERNRRQLIANQILGRILEEHDFKVPDWYVLMESQSAVKGMGGKWVDMSKEDIEIINQQSINKLKLSMILDSIRDVEPEAVFSETEIINTMRANIQQSGGNPDEVLSSAQRDGTLIGLIAKLRDEATIQWLIEQSSIIDETPVQEVQEEKEEQEVTTDG